MGKDLAPRATGSPTQRTSGEVTAAPGRPSEISTRSSGQLSYSPAEIIGFDHVPEQVVRQLRGENTIAGAGIAAWAEPPVAKRRADGSAYQVITAWWADSTRLVVLEVVRELADAGRGRLRPTGAWVPRGTVYQFPAGVSAVTYSSAPEPGGSGTDGDEAAAIAESPLDVLPEYLQSPLRGGSSGAFLHTRPKWARETVVGQRLDAGRARVIRAEREAKSQKFLSRSTWAITSIEAPVVGSQRIGPAPNPSRAVARELQTPSIEAPRTYW
jgi:hypothetical protein